MGSENLSGAKGNSHSRLNAHFAFLSVLNLSIIHYNNAVPVSDFCSSMEVSLMSSHTAQRFLRHENCIERQKHIGISASTSRFRGDLFVPSPRNSVNCSQFQTSKKFSMVYESNYEFLSGKQSLLFSLG